MVPFISPEEADLILFEGQFSVYNTYIIFFKYKKITHIVKEK